MGEGREEAYYDSSFTQAVLPVGVTRARSFLEKWEMKRKRGCFCWALVAVPTFEKQATGVEERSECVEAPRIVPVKSIFGSFTQAMKLQLNVGM